MKKIINLLLASAIVSILSTGCSKQKKSEILVLAAASLKDVCTELKNVYELQHEDVSLLFSFASSGALQTQIEEGAKADLFISADVKQMKALQSKGLMEEDSVINLLENKLVLVLPENSSKNINDFASLASDEVSMIAIGQPQSVPAGRYAMEVFDFLGISEAVKSKANYAMDVRSVLAWVEEGVVDCGLVYQTDALSSKKVRIAAAAPQGSLRRIIYPVGIVKGGQEPEKAKEFFSFLTSGEASKIFTSYGFSRAE